MGRHGVSGTVRPRTVVIGMVAVVVVIAAVVGASLWLRSQHPGAVKLAGPQGDSPVSYAGIFPAIEDEPLANPLGIAYDGEHLYVAESDAGTIRVFDTNGGRVGAIRVPVAEGQRSAYPSSIAIAGERLAVVDNAGNRVVLMERDATGDAALDVVLGEQGKAPEQPTAVAYAGGELFVADSADGAIKVYSEDGEHLRDLVSADASTAGFVTALAHAEGVLYAACSEAGTVLTFDMATDETDGYLSGEYSLPRAIEPLAGDFLAVVDGMSRSAHVVDLQGVEISAIDADTVPEGSMSAPRGAAWVADHERLYVTDADTGRVYVFNIRSDRL